jgi:hypothetical protein
MTDCVVSGELRTITLMLRAASIAMISLFISNLHLVRLGPVLPHSLQGNPDQ